MKDKKLTPAQIKDLQEDKQTKALTGQIIVKNGAGNTKPKG